jgi:hypothetical protein
MFNICYENLKQTIHIILSHQESFYLLNNNSNKEGVGMGKRTRDLSK